MADFKFYRLRVNFGKSVILDVNKLVRVAAEAIPTIIKKRVKKDLDAYDQPMQLLSPKTVERLRLEDKPEDPILRGPMIDNLTNVGVKKYKDAAVLRFMSEGINQRPGKGGGKAWAVIGAFHQLGLGAPRRFWFGLSKKDRRTLLRLLKKAGALTTSSKYRKMQAGKT